MNLNEKTLLRHIGDNLRAERVRRRMTQEMAASLSGLGTTQVARMERGETDSGVSKYVRLASAIGAPIDTLFQGVSWSKNGTGDLVADAGELVHN